MGHVQDNAEESVRRVLATLAPHGEFTCPLDDNGAKIVVAVRVDTAGRSAVIDFTGALSWEQWPIAASAATLTGFIFSF